MNIYYVKNAWGHKLPVYFDECCEVMTRLYNLETKPHKGFWFDPSDGELKEYDNGKIIGRVTRCWFCHTNIKLIERELKD